MCAKVKVKVDISIDRGIGQQKSRPSLASLPPRNARLFRCVVAEGERRWTSVGGLGHRNVALDAELFKCGDSACVTGKGGMESVRELVLSLCLPSRIQGTLLNVEGLLLGSRKGCCIAAGLRCTHDIGEGCILRELTPFSTRL